MMMMMMMMLSVHGLPDWWTGHKVAMALAYLPRLCVA